MIDNPIGAARTTRRIPATAAALQKYLLVLLLLLIPLHHADAFASYLLNNIGCMTDLSTDEVIMNAQVVAASDSDHKGVHLQLVSQEEVAQEEKMGDGSVRIFLKPSDHPRRLDLQLISEGVHDVQFVVETTEGASMEHGQCDNAKRVAARGKDVVTLELGASSEQPISVWAGWATGHEAVRLTPVLEFHLEAINQLEIDKQAKEKAKEKLVEQLQAYKNDLEKVEKQDEAAKKVEKSHHSNSDHRRAHQHHRQHRHHQQHQRHHHWSESNSGSGDSGDVVEGQVSSRSSSQRKKKPSTSRQSRPDRHHNTQQQHQASKKRRSLTQKIKDHIAKHRRQDGYKEPGIDLDTTWFFYGLAVLLLGTFLMIQCCIFVSGNASGGDEKGRRTL